MLDDLFKDYKELNRSRDIVKLSMEDNLIFKHFEDNPAYREVIHNDKKIGIHFIHKQREYGAKEIYIISKPENPIEVGDYIYHNDEIWLCYSYDTYPLRKHFMSYCNQTLRLYLNNEIIDIPSVVSDKTSVYSDGLNKGRLLTIPDDQILVTVPENEITKEIQLNQRFIFRHDKQAIFEVRRIDKLERDGLLDIRMRHSQYDKDRDNLEKGIADYYTISNDVDEGTTKVQGLTIEGNDSILLYSPGHFKVDTKEDVEFKILKGEDLVSMRVLKGNVAELMTEDKEGIVTLQACIGDTCTTKEIEVTDRRVWIK